MLSSRKNSWYEPHCELSFPGVNQHSYLWFDNYFVDRQAIAAKWIEDNAPPGALVASTPAGSIAFNLKHHRVIDMLGLNDEHIAHTDGKHLGFGRAGHEKGDGKYVMSRSPDYILMGNVAVLPFLWMKIRGRQVENGKRAGVWADPEFHKKYQLRCVRLADSESFNTSRSSKRRSPRCDRDQRCKTNNG